MSKVVWILAATSAGLGLTSLHLVKQLRDSDAAIVELQSQLASLRQEATAVPTFAPSSPPVVADAVERPGNVTPAQPKEVSKTALPQQVGAVSAKPPPLPSREESMRMMHEHRERYRQLLQDPEYREAMRLQSRSNLARQYPEVVQELGLDQQQADEFFGMLTDQQLRMSEQMEPLWDADNADKLDPMTIQDRHRKMQQTAAEMQRNNEAELAARFGQEKLGAWKEYQSTVGQRYQLEHIRNTLAAQGLPLSDDVSKPMLKALAAAQKAEMDEYSAAVGRGAAPILAANATSNVAFGSNNMEQQLESAKKRNQRTLDAISPYLSFEQRQTIEKEQEARLKMEEAQLRIMPARGDIALDIVFDTDSNARFIPVPQ